MKIIFFLCLIFMIFENYLINSDDIFSYIEVNSFSIGNIPKPVQIKVVEDYLFKRYDRNDDPVCRLSIYKKRALCELIFQLKHYQYIGIFLNKAALYLDKLPCIKHTLSFLEESAYSEIKIKQFMYQCPGRHKVIRTSFVEDDFYDKIYVSTGHNINMVTIYIHRKNEVTDWYNVYDHIHNVNLSALQDLIITRRDAIEELKLNGEISLSTQYDELETIYMREQDYYKNDPVCDLKHEEKITLCSQIYNQHILKNSFKAILNKGAMYLFTTDCEPKRINTRVEGCQRQEIKQNMYTCYGQKKIDNTDYNAITDELVKSFLLSKGPRRNSLYVYYRTNVTRLNLDGKYYILELIENINVQRLNPTVITIEDVYNTSPLTHKSVQAVIHVAEKRYRDHLEMSEKSFDKTFIMRVDVAKSSDLLGKTKQIAKLSETRTTSAIYSTKMAEEKLESRKEKFKSTKFASRPQLQQVAERKKKRMEENEKKKEEKAKNLLQEIIDEIHRKKSEEEATESEVSTEKENESNLTNVSGLSDFAVIGQQIIKMVEQKYKIEVGPSFRKKTNLRLVQKLEQRKKIELIPKQQKHTREILELITQMETYVLINYPKDNLGVKKKIFSETSEETSEEQIKSIEGKTGEEEKKKKKKKSKKKDKP